MDREEFLLKVRQGIEDEHLFSLTEDKILVGVSGGVDSMTLLLTLVELGCNVAIAHCNFQLRGEESDADECFVEEFAKKHSIPIHIRSFDTQLFAKEQKESIEMSARTLRYEWFETLCALHGYTHIAIAHNQNDSVETFFINLLRSTGIRGLTGIPVVNGRIVRPLLCVSRSEIEQFASQSNLSYRVDSSNKKNDYVRNKIRNIILPEMLDIFPNGQIAISETMRLLKRAYSLYSEAIEDKKRTCCKTIQGGFLIDELALQQLNESETILFEILYPCGYNPDVISQIYKSFESQSGKRFESDTHTAFHDRNHLYVMRKQPILVTNLLIDSPEFEMQVRDCLLIGHLCAYQDFHLRKDRFVASLNYAKLRFPLQVRPWSSGDSFVPFGMKGRKKVSDFLIDEKIPLHEKERVLVLVSGEEIVWVIGHRISQNYSIDKSVSAVLEIELRHI